MSASKRIVTKLFSNIQSMNGNDAYTSEVAGLKRRACRSALQELLLKWADDVCV
jgi:hypothetical protein